MSFRFLVAIALTLGGCDGVQLGRPGEAQAVGSRGLSVVTTDNDTLEGDGTTTTPVKLKKVYVDGVTVTGTGSAGSQLTTPWIAYAQGIFCDDSDGDATMDGSSNVTLAGTGTVITPASSVYTLPRDVCFHDLIIDGSSTVLFPNKYRIFAHKITFTNGSSIRANGGNAAGNSGGNAGGGTGWMGDGTIGGNGGTTGAGSSGASSNTTDSRCSTTTTTGGTAGVPTGQTGGLCHGGAGGRGTGANGSIGGVVANTGATVGDIRNFQRAMDSQAAVASSTVWTAGSGGGGGGGSATGNGGGGGGGGGWILVGARTFVVTSCHANGCIQARGGDGAAGAGTAGGGGGGGGGEIICVVGTGSCATMNVAGGVHGALSGAGSGNGGDGGDGKTITFLIGR